MAHDISWAAEKRVIYVRFSSHILFTELAEIHQKVAEYQLQGNQPVHVIVDARGIANYPHDVRWLIDSVCSDGQTEGWRLFVTTNPKFQFLLALVIRLRDGRFRVVPTLDAAQIFLREQDQTLPEIWINVKNRL